MMSAIYAEALANVSDMDISTKYGFCEEVIGGIR